MTRLPARVWKGLAGLRRAQTTTGGVTASPRSNTGIGTKPRLAGSPPGPRLGSTPLSKHALALLLMAVALAGCGTDERPSAIGTGVPAVGVPPNPLAGKVFFVDPVNPANRQAAKSSAADADQLRKIGARSVAHWLTTGTDATKEVDDLVTRAAAAGQLPVLVAYNIPGRDCGSYSAGGASSPEAYRSWIRTVVVGLKGRPAVVIVEPDAVPHIIEGCPGNEEQRYGSVRDAVTTLKSSPNAVVFLDAGHPGWVTDLPELADALRRAGAESADGFALNVSNFAPTADNFAYGDSISALLGGKLFVVDTSRNGAGQPAGDTISGGPSWCNPPGRTLGQPPTVDTGHARAAALLWVKYPGESDGACRPGEPAAGRWWPQYALDLARRS